jgi:DNA-binding XRE family transcriptional regulator
MAKSKERIIAQHLYVDSGLSQKQIAEQLDISEKTISKWKTEDNWDKIRTARRITKSELINKIYKSMNAVMADSNDVDRPLTSKEADIVSKLSNTLQKLEGQDTLSNHIHVLQQFFTWLKDIDLESAKTLSKYSKEFLINKAKA